MNDCVRSTNLQKLELNWKFLKLIETNQSNNGSGFPLLAFFVYRQASCFIVLDVCQKVSHWSAKPSTTNWHFGKWLMNTLQINTIRCKKLAKMTLSCLIIRICFRSKNIWPFVRPKYVSMSPVAETVQNGNKCCRLF